jgi:hypothetical protein
MWRQRVNAILSHPHEALDIIVAGFILLGSIVNAERKGFRRMLRKGGNAWQARIEGLVECSFFMGHAFVVVMANSLFVVESPSRFSRPESAVGLP